MTYTNDFLISEWKKRVRYSPSRQGLPSYWRKPCTLNSMNQAKTLMWKVPTRALRFMNLAFTLYLSIKQNWYSVYEQTFQLRDIAWISVELEMGCVQNYMRQSWSTKNQFCHMCRKTIFDLYMVYRTGGHRGGECNEDKKHYWFHLELNYELNLGLKQKYFVYGTIKGSSFNFRIMIFYSFSFFSKSRFPHVPRFDITQAICVFVTRHLKISAKLCLVIPLKARNAEDSNSVDVINIQSV